MSTRKRRDTVLTENTNPGVEGLGVLLGSRQGRRREGLGLDADQGLAASLLQLAHGRGLEHGAKHAGDLTRTDWDTDSDGRAELGTARRDQPEQPSRVC